MDVDGCLRNISDALYDTVNKKVGSIGIIRNRRMIMEIADNIHEIQSTKCPHDHLRSGSRSEGFRFIGSDMDDMVIYKDVIVKIDGNSNYYPMDNKTVLMMETHQTRPGFCMLRLISRSYLIEINKFCVQYQTSLYLSSAIWRDKRRGIIRESQIHGPCENGMMGAVEADYAHSLKCENWLKSTLHCISRLARAGWPHINVLSNIVNNGCHLVPIGDKLSDREIIEWRISFSAAEKLLIYEMNHCQFLCYGLLKIFLKEAINANRNVDGLICSYFLKTIMLWEITDKRTSWMEQDFLTWFWICFRRLISWVVHGYCPNFFIPENNMFLGKIYGRSQQLLLHHLTSMYKEGYKCLIRCTSLCEKLRTVLCPNQNGVLLPPVVDSLKALEDIDFIVEVCNNCVFVENLVPVSRIIAYLQHNWMPLVTQRGLLQTNPLLQHATQIFLFCFALRSFPSERCIHNKVKYDMIRKVLKSLKGYKYDLLSHRIFSALILYKFGMYYHVLKTTFDMTECIRGPHSMYIWTLNESRYTAQGGEYTPVDSMMRNYLVRDVQLKKSTCLPELYLEHQASCCHISYPPMVLLKFMAYLSYYHLSMYSEADVELRDLTFLIHNDIGHHIFHSQKIISWEILGICQEMGGYLEDASFSYQRALREPLIYKFRDVTLTRIQNVNAILNNL